MSARILASLFALLAAPAVTAESLAELAAQVRATEIAFAKTLADRDVAAFRRMIAPDVIWIADVPLRGPDEVLTRWRKFFEGPKAPFSWAPEIVEVQEGGRIALSSGPVLDPAGKRVATFTSIWRREAGGEWKIIFDRGCDECQACAQIPKEPAT